jgi:hypothetical protein
MLTDRTADLYAIDETETPSDRAMLVLQYLTAGIAVVAAALLAFVR